MYKSVSSMTDVRREIDELDRLIVPLLLKRLHFITEAARLKQNRNKVRDNWRVEDVVTKALAETRKLEGDPLFIEKIYRHLIECSIAYEFETFDELEKTNL